MPNSPGYIVELTRRPFSRRPTPPASQKSRCRPRLVPQENKSENRSIWRGVLGLEPGPEVSHDNKSANPFECNLSNGASDRFWHTYFTYDWKHVRKSSDHLYKLDIRLVIAFCFFHLNPCCRKIEPLEHKLDNNGRRTCHFAQSFVPCTESS